MTRKKPKGVPSQGPVPLIRYVDDQIVVVDKPSGLTTMRHGYEERQFGPRAQRFLPPTLADRLPRLLQAKTGRWTKVIAVHRLDRDTSGLVIFALRPKAGQELSRQFREHTVSRRYLAIVRGRAEPRKIESWLVPDRGDGRRGSGRQSGEGKRAVTHVSVVEELGDFTLVECRLETGRTHQVRIHLGEQGWPICGERVYDRPLHGKPLPDTSQSPRLALHAATLGVTHPVTGARMHWQSPLPKTLADLVRKLRNRH